MTEIFPENSLTMGLNSSDHRLAILVRKERDMKRYVLFLLSTLLLTTMLTGCIWPWWWEDGRGGGHHHGGYHDRR